jgi:hypothetical protein
VLAALRAGERPTDVAEKSPFTEAYVRRLGARERHPECLLRRYPKARAKLEPRLPRWREAAKAIGELGIGPDDAECVDGVLWYCLTLCGGEGNHDQQKRAITDRLVSWATRDGGDGDQAAAASAPSWKGISPDGSRTAPGRSRGTRRAQVQPAVRAPTVWDGSDRPAGADRSTSWSETIRIGPLPELAWTGELTATRALRGRLAAMSHSGREATRRLSL